MILRNKRDTNHRTERKRTRYQTKQRRSCILEKQFEKEMSALLDRYDKRLGRLEYSLKQISDALNVQQNYENHNFLKNDLNRDGWLHEYTFGSRIYHAGYQGHVVEETRLRVIFTTHVDGKQVALSVSKSDIGRDGRYTLYEQCT